MEKTINKQIFCECSPELVWQSLTDPEDISAWLMTTSNFKAEVGASFTLQTKPMGKWDGKIYGEILVADKPKTLSYTWKGDQMNSTTILTWLLIPQNNGTLLKMEHKGFRGFSDFILGTFHAMGWGKFLKQLKTRVETNGKG